MRVCRIIETGKIIEMQSHAIEGTLISNAVNAGYSAIDIEEAIMTQSEYDAAMLAQTPQEEIERREINQMIADKSKQLAIDDLVKNNKLEIIEGKVKKVK